MYRITTYINGHIAHQELLEKPDSKTHIRLFLKDILFGIFRRSLTVEVRTLELKAPWEEKPAGKAGEDLHDNFQWGMSPEAGKAVLD